MKLRELKRDTSKLEKIDVPKRETWIASLWRILKRDARLMYQGIKIGILEPLVLLARMFVPRSVDNVVRPQADWYEIQPERITDSAILLIHGFGSTPEIFKEIAPLLVDEGYHVRAARIAGHGTTPSHLAHVTPTEMISSVVWHYKQIQDDFEDIYIVGHSLGGTIGLVLCSLYPIKSIICLSTPIKLHIPPAKFVRQASILVKYWPRGRDKRQTLEREEILTYRKNPLYAIGGIFEICDVARSRADKLDLPVLYVRAMNDHPTLMTQPEEFRKAFPNTPTEFRDAEDSPHALLQGPKRELVWQWIIEWINNH